MKKLLLGMAFFSLTSLASAQVLLSENFNGMTIGNVGTDLTGATAGQGSWFTGNTTGGTNGNVSNYQIVASNGSNALQITGSNAATGSRFMWKDGLDLSWAARTTGNDIIEVEFDFNPSVASASNNSFRVYIYSDEATPKVLAGIGVTSNAVVSTVPYTNVVTGFGYWTSTPGTGVYSFGLGPNAATPITLADDAWVRLGFSFNKTTGEIIWKGPGFNSSFTGNAAGGFPVVTAGLNPGEQDFVVAAGTGNTVADIGLFDNLVVKATATDTLLGTNQVALETNTVSVYPNPASTTITVASTELSINSIEMTDINGRVVKTLMNSSNEAQINISDLSEGVYVMKITSSEGTVTTKKIVKK